jgi:1,4-dihydroxy-2-naphthoyl-CoA hydrolase
MPVDARTIQPFGRLHGGANVLLAETLGSAASAFCIDPKTHFAVGLEVNANHIAGATKGSVLGTCRPVHLGSSTHVWDIRIAQEERLISACRLTVSVVAKRSGA